LSFFILGNYPGKLSWEIILGNYPGKLSWEIILGIYPGNLSWEIIAPVYFFKKHLFINPCRAFEIAACCYFKR